MDIFFTVTLAVSIVGLLALLTVKRYELSGGRIVLPRVRPAVGRRLGGVLGWAEYVLPGLVRYAAMRAWRFAEVQVHRLAALVVLLVERGLERLLKALKYNTEIRRSDTDASAFLREVSAHKKALLRDTRKQNKIYEE